jgi:2-polyprenyl-3-methyl-5-hydroxy-6-metoxy-1,4-benzoquinol methylase
VPHGTLAGLGVIRRGSAGAPLGSRLHILGRYLTCPFPAAVDALPPGARVLDVGAGHGVFARLAVERRGARVVAVEPDVRKMNAALRHPSVRWIAGFDTCVRGQFDAVALCDVLYRVPETERDPLLARLFDRLRPGGLLVLKEVDPDRRLKFFWNVAQEFVAIRVLRLTLGSGLVYENREVIGRRLARAGFADFTARAIDAGYPHSHVLYTARRPG